MAAISSNITPMASNEQQAVPSSQPIATKPDVDAREVSSKLGGKIKQSSTSILLRLPGELRNLIYDMALFHEGGGVISPVHSYSLPAPKDTMYCPAMILRAGQRCYVRDGTPAIQQPIHHQLPASTNQKERHAKMLDIWKELPTQQRDHICTVKCLCLPPLTQVSVQIRGETLPVFYSVNKFHIELSNFSLLGAPTRTPISRWRSIGDDKLRLITRLNLFVSTIYRGIRGSVGQGVMIRYRKSAGSLEIGVQAEDLEAGYDWSSSVGRGLQQVKADLKKLETEMSLVKTAVVADGLSIAALERLSVPINERMTEYLPKPSRVEINTVRKNHSTQQLRDRARFRGLHAERIKARGGSAGSRG